MSFGFFVLQCFYFMLPAYFANMAPVFFKNSFSFLAKPIDFGKTWKGKPLFGAHKTFRGFVMGTLLAIIITFIQFQLFSQSFFTNLSLFSYDNWLLLGILMGFGALTGDAIKSLIKRRISIKPGKPWVPFDQLDFVVGALFFSWLIIDLNLKIVLTILIMSPFLHILTNHTAFFLKIRGEKW